MMGNMEQRPLSKLSDVTLVVLPAEAAAIVGCLRMCGDLLHQNYADYGRDGRVVIWDLRAKLIHQVEQQRTVVSSGISSTTPRE